MAIPYIRILLWLRWTLLWRGFSRDRVSMAGTIIGMVIIWPWSILMALWVMLGLNTVGPPDDLHLLTAVLMGAYTFWIIMPMMGYALNESYDITRLFVYPLSMRQILFGAIVGSLLNFPTLFLIPLAIVCTIHFSSLITVATMAVFLFHTLALSQSVLLLSAGILRSRKFRDLLLVLLPLLWLCYYIFSNSMAHRTAQVDWRSVWHSDRWDYAVALPPGMAARAMAAAARSDYATAVLYLGLLAAVAIGAVLLCAWVLEKLYQGEAGEGVVRDKRATVPSGERVIQPSGSGGLVARLPPVIQAMLMKESRYLRRDPAFKLLFMNQIWMLVVGILMFSRRDSGNPLTSVAPTLIWVITGWMLFSETSLLFNVFGGEGSAASVLILFPSPRHQILLAKNIVSFLMLSALHLAFTLIVTALANAFEMFLPMFVWMELALIIFMAVGNMVSIHLPMRTAMMGRRARQQSFGQGCGYSFLYLALTGIAIALTLPALACVIVPTFFIDPKWYALTLPIGAIYAVALYVLGLKQASIRFLAQETEIAAKVGTAEV